jgi:glycosyltransferase involved in cell wall biosynthesis
VPSNYCKPLNERCGSVSAVIPVFDEAETLERVVSRLLRFDRIEQVVIVDDGSGYETQQVLNRLSTIAEVRILRHRKNAGKGAALRSGIAACRCAIVVFQDADLEYHPEDLPSVIAPILRGDADVVFGSRELGCKFKGAKRISIVANRLLTRLANWRTGLQLTDIETGCKAFRRVVLGRITIEENGFGVEPELTLKIAALKYRLTEVPINYNPRGVVEGKKIQFVDGLRAIWCIVRY